MKVILTRPAKIKGSWEKADTEVDVPKKEYEFLCSKGACVKPLAARAEFEETEEK